MYKIYMLFFGISPNCFKKIYPFTRYLAFLNVIVKNDLITLKCHFTLMGTEEYELVID
jgi:hypothetical protein